MIARPRGGVLRLAGRAVLIVAVLAAAAFVVGAAIPRRPEAVEPAGQEGATRRVLVLANAIHTDIALPADPDILARFRFLAADGLPLDAPELEWLVIGWGGRDFYLETPTWSELKPGPLAKALTIDRSVMHVALGGAIAPGIAGVVPLDLGEAQLNAMIDEVLASFIRDGSGRPVAIAGAGYTPFDRFYEAHGLFNVLVGCNLWSGRVLRSAGIATGWWNPLPLSLLWSLRVHNDLPDEGLQSAEAASYP